MALTILQTFELLFITFFQLPLPLSLWSRFCAISISFLNSYTGLFRGLDLIHSFETSKTQKQSVKAWFPALDFEKSPIIGRPIDIVGPSVIPTNPFLSLCSFAKISASDLFYTSIIIKRIILKKLNKFGISL